jgi:hypothetical protein
MSEEERRLDQVARSSVCEAGYVGLVNQRLGSRLRDPKLWKAEGGWEPEEDKARVDEMMRGVEEENERRRGTRVLWCRRPCLRPALISRKYDNGRLDPSRSYGR